MTFAEISKKYSSDRVATRIVEAKRSDPTISRSQIRDHPDCPGDADSSLNFNTFFFDNVKIIMIDQPVNMYNCTFILRCNVLLLYMSEHPQVGTAPEELEQFLIWDVEAQEDEDTCVSTIFSATDNDSPKKKKEKAKGKKSKKRKASSSDSSTKSSDTSDDDGDSSTSSEELWGEPTYTTTYIHDDFESTISFIPPDPFCIHFLPS